LVAVARLQGRVQRVLPVVAPTAAFDRRENLAGSGCQRSFTIPEGWSLRQMAATLKTSVFPATDFLAAASQMQPVSVVTC